MADELIKVAEDSARSGFFLISGTALSTVILAISSILIGRLLGPELYGQYTLVLVVPTLLLTFTDLAIYIRITSISTLFHVILTTATSAFVGLDKTEYNALAANIQALAKTIISISLVLLGFGVAGALVGYVAGYVVAATAGITILFLTIREKQSAQDDYSISSDLKTLLHYGAPLYVSVLLVSIVPLYQNL